MENGAARGHLQTAKGVSMKFFLTGGTGFVGRALVQALIRGGNEVTILTRSLQKYGSRPPGVALVEGNPAEKGEWQKSAAGHDGIINLAGASIFGRWTDEIKRALRESRILATRNLVDAIADHEVKIFLSTSAVGYYGFHGDEELTEESPPGKDFLAQLAVDWEKEALKAKDRGVRVVLMRFGIVLGEGGGALGQMIPLFKKDLGGPLGSGKQWFSWIHREDLSRAVLFLADRPEISGPVNLTAPNPVRNKDLAAAIGKAMHRPAFMRVPGFMLRLALGEFGSVLLEGQKVIPRKLLEGGFQFQYPRIEGGLAEIFENKK
jgi:uncharacterized protein